MPDTHGLEDRSLVFTWEDIKKILIVAKADSLRNFTILFTLSLTGRRLGEVIGRGAMIGKRGVIPEVPGLYVEDINFTDQQIRWCIEKKFKDKAHTERVYRIKDAQPELLSVLNHWININNLKPGMKMFNASEKSMNKMVHKYLIYAGLLHKARVCHAFRHGFGLQFAKTMEKPSDIIILQDILDHNNPGTTFGYVKMASGETKKALGKITLAEGEENP